MRMCLLYSYLPFCLFIRKVVLLLQLPEAVYKTALQTVHLKLNPQCDLNAEIAEAYFISHLAFQKPMDYLFTSR